MKLKEERENAIKQEEERKAERTQFLEEEKAKWDEEHAKKDEEENPEQEEKSEQDSDAEGEDKEAEGEEKEEEKFDEAFHIAKFDEEKPEIPIPPEVIDDIDNDIELSEEDLAPPADQE